MGDTKDFGLLEKDLAHFARAIGHPARVAVLLEIARRGNQVAGEIIDIPPLSKATVLQHLRELKRAGLVQGRIFGSKASYSLDLDNILRFQKDFHQFIHSFGERHENELKNP